jgi:hypothetical protein
MGKDNCCERLEDVFTATFQKELVPGILHNFANPLGGIMGRAKLLKRRLDESVGKVRQQHPDAFAAMRSDFERLQADIDAISNESDRFFGMFRDLTGKLQALDNREDREINLSHLFAQEVRFADFYLDFKHEVEKELILDGDTPELTGSEAGYSLAVWSLIRYCLQRMRGSAVKEFRVSSTHDDTFIFLEVGFSGPGLTNEERGFLREDPTQDHVSEGMESLVDACSYLRACGAVVGMQCEALTNTLTVAIPYAARK